MGTPVSGSTPGFIVPRQMCHLCFNKSNEYICTTVLAQSLKLVLCTWCYQHTKGLLSSNVTIVPSQIRPVECERCTKVYVDEQEHAHTCVMRPAYGPSIEVLAQFTPFTRMFAVSADEVHAFGPLYVSFENDVCVLTLATSLPDCPVALGIVKLYVGVRRDAMTGPHILRADCNVKFNMGNAKQVVVWVPQLGVKRLHGKKLTKFRERNGHYIVKNRNEQVPVGLYDGERLVRYVAPSSVAYVPVQLCSTTPCGIYEQLQPVVYTATIEQRLPNGSMSTTQTTELYRRVRAPTFAALVEYYTLYSKFLVPELDAEVIVVDGVILFTTRHSTRVVFARENTNVRLSLLNGNTVECPVFKTCNDDHAYVAISVYGGRIASACTFYPVLSRMHMEDSVCILRRQLTLLQHREHKFVDIAFRTVDLLPVQRGGSHNVELFSVDFDKQRRVPGLVCDNYTVVCRPERIELISSCCKYRHISFASLAKCMGSCALQTSKHFMRGSNGKVTVLSHIKNQLPALVERVMNKRDMSGASCYDVEMRAITKDSVHALIERFTRMNYVVLCGYPVEKVVKDFPLHMVEKMQLEDDDDSKFHVTYNGRKITTHHYRLLCEPFVERDPRRAAYKVDGAPRPCTVPVAEVQHHFRCDQFILNLTMALCYRKQHVDAYMCKMVRRHDQYIYFNPNVAHMMQTNGRVRGVDVPSALYECVMSAVSKE